MVDPLFMEHWSLSATSHHVCVHLDTPWSALSLCLKKTKIKLNQKIPYQKGKNKVLKNRSLSVVEIKHQGWNYLPVMARGCRFKVVNGNVVFSLGDTQQWMVIHRSSSSTGERLKFPSAEQSWGHLLCSGWCAELLHTQHLIHPMCCSHGVQRLLEITLVPGEAAWSRARQS